MVFTGHPAILLCSTVVLFIFLLTKKRTKSMVLLVWMLASGIEPVRFAPDRPPVSAQDVMPDLGDPGSYFKAMQGSCPPHPTRKASDGKLEEGLYYEVLTW